MALLDVVQWDNQKGDIIYKFPEGAVSLGAQLIVKEGQEAIFFREGKALDSFGPGRHTLKTGNIPILEKLINLPFGGKTPFPAEVYYINKSEVPNLKWGTKQPIQLLDPIYNIAVPLRAFGAYSIKSRTPRPPDHGHRHLAGLQHRGHRHGAARPDHPAEAPGPHRRDHDQAEHHHPETRRLLRRDRRGRQGEDAATISPASASSWCASPSSRSISPKRTSRSSGSRRPWRTRPRSTSWARTITR